MNPTPRPLYLAEIDEDDDLETGVKVIAFVEKPASGVEGIALSEETQVKVEKLSLDEDRMMYFGPALVPNKRIFRNDGTETGRDIMFTPKQVEIIRNKFHQTTGNLKLSNHNHVATDIVNAYLSESWIIEDKTHDKAVKLGYDLPLGTWMVGYKVTDRDYWLNEVKTGNIGGFSPEGGFKFKQTFLSADTPDDEAALAPYRQIIEEFMKTYNV